MNRRESLKYLGTGLALSILPWPNSIKAIGKNGLYVAGLKKPTSVYITWAAHDELSDTIPLTEALAMKQLNEMLRLKKEGMFFDYYLMDMFWFDKNLGYREFKREGWPNGPDNWIAACLANGIKPGLWLSTNVMGWGKMRWMLPIDEWKDSSCWNDSALCMFYGGYLNSMIKTMQMWYDKGIRMFKFDFANFLATPDEFLKTHTEREIIEKNEAAWFSALKIFREKNPEIVLLAYNGYGGQLSNTSVNIKKTVDLKWLEVFESLYCGDPRPADVPCHNFWRSKDIYSDHMVFQYQRNGVPLDRIDNTAFMIGTTGTCYKRGKQAWKGMLILSGARGGWMNTYYGNLDLLTNEDARWASKVQAMFYSLQEYGRFETFGNLPGSATPYGFVAREREGRLVTVINPSQKVCEIDIPSENYPSARLLFTDQGFRPVLSGNKIVLGPEQMALVGFGKYNADKYDLGVEADVFIPLDVVEFPIQMVNVKPGQWRGTLMPPVDKKLRFVFRLTTPNGEPLRITGGELAERASMGTIIRIEVTQQNKPIPMVIHYDKKIWSGLSWAVAETEMPFSEKAKPLNVLFYADPAQVANAHLHTTILGITI